MQGDKKQPEDLPRRTAGRVAWGAVAVLGGALLGFLIRPLLLPGQVREPYTVQLIAQGGGMFVISQRTGRVYAVSPFGQAEFVADLREWEDDKTIRPGTELRRAKAGDRPATGVTIPTPPRGFTDYGPAPTPPSGFVPES